MTTEERNETIRMERVIGNLRKSYAELHAIFRAHYMEAMQMRSWVLLYATCFDDVARKELDDELKEDHPDIWRDIQEWHKIDSSYTP